MQETGGTWGHCASHRVLSCVSLSILFGGGGTGPATGDVRAAAFVGEALRSMSCFTTVNDHVCKANGLHMIALGGWVGGRVVGEAGGQCCSLWISMEITCFVYLSFYAAPQ